MTGATQVRGRGNATPLVAGEFALTGDDFAQIASLLYDTAGIALHESKATLVYSRLAKRLRALGLENFRQYCEIVQAAEGVDERQMMLAALTTNVTRFFREPHHFEHLEKNVILPIVDDVRKGARLRFWSAGCSTGQEPYSLALTILKCIPDAPNLDVRILATDIDTNVIATGRRGVYSEDLIAPIPVAMRSQWLEPDRSEPGSWSMGAAVRSLVTFNELNLMGKWPIKVKFQAIFCRNVVIYFDEPTQERMWSRFGPLLTDDGRLYVGHSERVVSEKVKFESDGLTTYKVAGGSAR